MWAWIVAAPVGFMLMLFGLAWLEETIVYPVDRAAQISKALERAGPEEIEGLVAQMLAPIVPSRRAS